MDFLTKFRRQVRTYLFFVLLVNNALLLGIWWFVQRQYDFSSVELVLGLGSFALIETLVFAVVATRHTTQPVEQIWQAILHVAPDGQGVAAPDLKKAVVGRELVANLTNHIYQLASVVDSVTQTSKKTSQELHSNFLASALPLPLVVLDKDDTIVYVNEVTAKYLHRPADELIGQNVYTALDMSFVSDNTFASWLTGVRQKSVTADSSWERVRIGLSGDGQSQSLQFDLAAHYNKANPMGYETLLILFDHTAIYSQDDQAVSFVALSVHELRTPLTLLRGYIEVFDEEFGPTLTGELKDFMKKMDASAQQLAAFVDNILNVAKIEDNQLTLQLHEEQWQSVLETVVRDLSLRANVRGIRIKTDISAGLPTVGVDRYSIYEVVGNLLDNAIKYSKGTSEIYLTSQLNSDGLVETSVKDFGLGIDVSVLPHIFDKFYRNHRNRAQIGGTGLGLYLSKAIVDAHGGQIWVRSKEGEGSTFSFTVQPYAKLAAEQKNGDTSITRGAHGWIKNHSLYRD